jgi:hypothetical protein
MKQLRLLLAAVPLSLLALGPAFAAPKGKSVGPYADVDMKDMPPAKEGDGVDLQDENQPREARPKPPTTGAPAAVTFSARLSENNAAEVQDVVWRVFEGRAGRDGSYRLIKTLRDARPTLELGPGEYLVNVAYGRANITKRVAVWPEKPMTEEFTLLAGGLRLSATLAKAPITTDHLLKFELYAETQDQFGNRRRVPVDLRQGVVVRLNSGLYHIVSTYGDANSSISADIVVEPGKITEAIIDHDAAKVTLKLVQRAGGEAVADSRWLIQNAAGETIKETAGAFPTHILAAGEYRAVAQLGDKLYSQSFKVGAGTTSVVEVVMQ